MGESEGGNQEKRKVINITTFPVPLSIEEIKQTIFSNNSAKYTKDQIITQAFKFHSEGNITEAKKYYQLCIKQGCNDPRVYSNYGIILKNIGNLKEAKMLQLKAIEIKPDYAQAHNNLGSILKDLSELKEAEVSLRKAIEFKPDYSIAYANLGVILMKTGKLKEAEINTRKAIELNADSAQMYFNLGQILKELGKSKEAKDVLKKALQLTPGNLEYNVISKLVFSTIPMNNKQINTERNEYQKQISIIKNDTELIFNDEPFSTNMFKLAYHNRYNDKLILKELAKALSRKEGIVNRTFNKAKQIKEKKRRNHIRLGIISDFLNEHSVCNYFGNIIMDIASTDIEVLIFRGPNAEEDKNSQLIDTFSSEVIRLPNSIKEATNLMINKSIDIIWYLDIGMSNYTYLLSLSRLALVQVQTLGHPNTSGSNEIDYCISCDNYETKNSHLFYSERLVRFSRIPANYSTPKIKQSTFKLSDTNLSAKSFLIGIPHSPIKFHPDYDLVLDKILEEIPNSYLFYLDGTKTYETDKLKHRWSKYTKFVLKRTIFHRRVGFDDFLEIVKNLDIILDPFYFGMGNTFYHSMAFNTPVVTMPTSHMKSRHAYAGYMQMGIINAPIASTKKEYISFCKKLAFDKSYMNNIRSQINYKSRRNLFNDKDIYKEYIDFFKASLNAAKENTYLPRNWSPKSIRK